MRRLRQGISAQAREQQVLLDRVLDAAAGDLPLRPTASTYADSRDISGRARVLDGDTVTLNGVRVRLKGVAL